MATIPNLYFQSPHIESAARNLASALAPPDPMTLLERESKQFAFEQAKKNANLADVQRADEEEARNIAAQIAELQPVLDANGRPDPEATRAEAMRLYGAYLRHRGSPKEANLIAGPYAPDFMSRLAIEQQKAQARLGVVGVQQAGAMDIAQLVQGETTKRHTAALENKLTLQELRNDASWRAEMLRAKTRLAVEDAKAKASGKDPMKVTDSDLEMIQYLIYSLEKDTGKKLFGADKHRLTDAAIREFQRTRNPEGAVLSVWDSTIGTTQRPERQPSGWEWIFGATDDPYLTPDFTKLGTVDYGTVLAPNVPTQAPTPAPAPNKVTPKPASRRPPNVPKDPNKRKPLSEILGK